MNRKQIPRVILFFGALGLVSGLAYIGASRTFAEHGTSRTAAAPAAQPSVEELDRLTGELVQQRDEDDAKPRYYGSLGSFDVVADKEEVQPAKACPDGLISPAPGTSIVPSELNRPGLTEQVVCADGSVVGTYGESGRRTYFTGQAKVVESAPLERLELTTIDGHEALLVHPVGEVGAYDAYVIQRRPSEEARGILLLVVGNTKGEAMARAQKSLAQ